MAFVDYYAILEIAPTASDEEVAAAVKQQRRTWAKRQGHPDQQRRHEAEERIGQLAQAERVLLDPARRREFDQTRSNRPHTSASGSPVPSGGDAGDWLARARQFIEAGDFNSANYAAREATQAEPQNGWAWATRAETSDQLGNHRDAVFEMSEAARIDPSEPSHQFDLGTLYEGAGEWTPALAAFNKGKELDPSNPLFDVAIGSVLTQSGKGTEAIRVLETANAEHPGLELVHYYLGIAYHDAVIELSTPLPDGMSIITTAEQAQRAVGLMDKAAKLTNINDKELETELRDMRREVQATLKPEWVFRSWIDQYGVGPVLCMALCIGYLWFMLLIAPASGEPAGILGTAAAVGVAYLAFNHLLRQPGWKINQRAVGGPTANPLRQRIGL